MKKKNLVAMGLAGVMLVGSCVPVLAAADTHNSELKVNVPESYKITIPAELTFDTTTNKTTETISVTETILNDGNKLVVSLPDTDIKLYLKGNIASDKIYVGKFSDKDSVLTFDNNITEGAASKKNLEFISVDKTAAKTAGEYSGSVVFTVSSIEPTTP